MAVRTLAQEKRSRGSAVTRSTGASAVDWRIEAAGAFAQRTLYRLRAFVHPACPEVEEAVKRKRPVFCYRSRILCLMAAFAQNGTFGVWGEEMSGVLRAADLPAHGVGGCPGRLRRLADLPPDDRMRGWIRHAAALVNAGAGTTRKRVARAPIELPQELRDALGQRPEVLPRFEGLPPGCRREYATWGAEAKRPETRARRVAEVLALVAAGNARYGGRSA